MNQFGPISMFKTVGNMGCAINHKKELGCWNLKDAKIEDMFNPILLSKKIHVNHVSISNSHICVITANEGLLSCSSM